MRFMILHLLDFMAPNMVIEVLRVLESLLRPSDPPCSHQGDIVEKGLKGNKVKSKYIVFK